MRAAFAAVVALALAPAGASAATCGSTAGVPAFAPGAQPAGDEAISAYLDAVGRASTRVISGVAGTSVEGRPLPYAVVSSPHNLARLGTIAARARASRQGRGRAAGGPAIVWLAAGVHGNEPSGTDADLQLLSELARGTSCEMLDRLVVVFMPVQNPDGRAANTRMSGAGFDLNRDWFARTQPETAAKLDLLVRYPPVAFADQHEEGGASFFFPPDTDPVHHEVPSAALRAISATIGPALREAFTRAGVPFVTGTGYDLFFMGYGDSATTTLFGAAGMTFEKGADAPFGEKVAQHHLAAATLLRAVAAHRAALLRAWDRSWRQALDEGRRGTLEPNTTQARGIPVDVRVPRTHTYAYAWRGDVAAADGVRLAGRLRSVGVRVNRLRRAVSVRAFHAYGIPGARRRTLPAGTWVVTLAQTQKHWVEAILGEDPYAAVPYFYDVASWSNPLLMGLDGGAIRSRLPSGVLGPGVVARGGAGSAFPGDAEGSAEAALELLGRGVALARVPRTGEFVLPAGTDATAVLAAHSVPALAAVPAGAVALRAPKVALLAALTDPANGLPSASSQWARWLLERRLGLTVDVLGDADLAAGRLVDGGYTALVVADGSAPAPSAAALAAVQAWVRAGGTFAGWRGAGIAYAQGAAITTATSAAPEDPQAPGVSLGVQLDPADPVAWGERGQGFAFAAADPVLHAAGGTVVARYPAGAAFFAGGYAAGTGRLRGTAAVIDEPIGAGRTVLFAFDPAFRGYTEGTERLVANALLAPPTGAAPARARPVRVARSIVAPFSEEPRP
ncbi:MAG: hypothetical protein QOH62_715 [Solirubrobacteraceae bacterium]|nr:hypothetical protein [Solirubrobacteraceae bacterium]